MTICKFYSLKYYTTAPIINYDVINQTGILSYNITQNGEEIASAPMIGIISVLLNLKPGTYNITYTNPKNEYYTSSSTTAEFTINKASSSIEITSVENGTYNTTIPIINYDVINQTDILNYNITQNGEEIASAPMIGLDKVFLRLNPGTYNITYTNPENEYYTSSSTTAEFTINKAKSRIIISEVENTTYGNDMIIPFAIENKTNLNITVINIDTNVKVRDITINENNISISNLVAGDYNITIKNEESEKYLGASAGVNFTINRIPASIDFSNSLVFLVGGSDSTTITIIGGSLDNINVIDQPEANITREGNLITVSNLTNGSYLLNVTVTPDENHTAVDKTLPITVTSDKLTPNFKITVEATREDSPVIINVTANETFTGNVGVSLGGKNITVSVVDGFGTAQTILSAGTYNAVINFTESDLYKAEYTNQSFTVKAALVDPNLAIKVDDVTLGDDVVVVITTNNSFTGNVSVKVNGEEKNANIINGEGNVTFTISKADTYNATAVFSETDVFTASEKNTTFTVEKINPNLTVTINPVYFGNDIIVVITIDKSFTGNVLVKTDNENSSASITNGSGSIALRGYEIGTHSVSVSFAESEKFQASEINTSAVVKKLPVDPKLTISVASITQGAKALVKITTNNTYTGSVNVKIANKNYNVAVKNGAGSISIASLGVGTYTAVATFTATSDFTSSQKTATFKVNKKVNVISLALKSVIVKKSAKKLVLQATLKINKKAVKGKVITFKFNGKTFKAKTNAKGIAKVTIKKAVLKKLKVGKKIIYTAKYSTKTVKKSVKVKK